MKNSFVRFVACSVANSKNLQKTVIFTLLVSVFSFAQSFIPTPANWPGTNMTLGMAWASNTDGDAIKDNAGALGDYYVFRYMDFTWQTDAAALLAFREMADAISNMPGTPHLAAVMSLFRDKTFVGISDVERRDRILIFMNDLAQTTRWFNTLRSMSVVLNGQSKPMAVIEPQVWSLVLQARFHFDEVDAAGAGQAGNTYKNVLSFPAQVRQAMIAAGFSAEIAANFQDNVAGLARAMIWAARNLMPEAVIAGHTATWAVYADGCSSGGGVARDGVLNGSIDIKATDGVVTWGGSDRNLSAYANVKFFRELFGWNDASNAPLEAAFWPDIIALGTGGSDAGLVQLGPTQLLCSEPGPGSPCYPLNEPGANSTAFYWGQSEIDNWLSWAKNFSHGIGLPLLGYNIPVGNGSLPNTPFHYQSTFSDWLYSSNLWTTALPGREEAGVPAWQADNWQRFKDAGFMGIWIGRTGWPAAGTHFGRRSDATNTGGPAGAITGDGGVFIKGFAAKDRSIPTGGISRDFDETLFADFSGFCEARSEATVKTGLTGVLVPGHEGVFEGTGPRDSLSISVSGAGNPLSGNSENIQALPEYLKSNAMWLFAEKPEGGWEPIQGTAGAVNPLAGVNVPSAGVNNDLVGGAPGQISSGQVLTDMAAVNPIGLSLTVDYGTVQGFDSWDSTNQLAGTFPLEYELFIYDHLGQYINSSKGYLSELDVVRYLKNDGKDNLSLDLLIQFIPMAEDGSHLGSGVYFLRGFFQEQKKTMCQPIDVSTGEPTSTLEPLNVCTVDPNDWNALLTNFPLNWQEKIEPYKNRDINGTPVNWKKDQIQNSIVVRKAFGYMR